MHAQTTPTPEYSKMLLVFGEKYFPEENWRDAINCFLTGMWGGKRKLEAQRRPELRFGSVVLQSGSPYGLKGYVAWGLNRGETAPQFPSWLQTLTVRGDDCNEVELGLARFVRNDDIRKLIIDFGGHGDVQIWKKDRRGAFGISA